MVGVGVRWLSVVIWLACSGVNSAKYKTPFFDPVCLSMRDCSWSWNTSTYGTQFCEREAHNDVFDLCPNPFTVPSEFGVEDRPPKAKIVTVVDMSKNFASSDGESVEQYTCVKIKIKIDQYSASKVKGIQLYVKGTEQPDLGRRYCMILNFTSAGLEYKAVEMDNITCDCFCGLKPGRRYEVMVRTMPVDSIDDIHDTKVLKYFTSPGCSDPNKTKDVRCQKSEEALWGPQCIQVLQNTSTGYYDSIEFSFDVAPSRYNFDIYWIFITPSAGRVRPVSLKVDMATATIVNRTCPLSDEQVAFVTVSSNVANWNPTGWTVAPHDPLVAKVQPRPTESQCKNAEGDSSTCLKSPSDEFYIINDPCEGNPCGQNGKCNSEGSEYSCDCIPGYAEFEKTCKVDPCLFMESDDMKYTSQCTNGECMDLDEGEDYRCECDDGYFEVGKKCLANPCSVNPETNTTVCGVHGSCRYNASADPVISNCDCDPGYRVWDNDECKEDTTGMVIVVTVGSCLLGLALFLTVLFVYCCLRSKIDPPPPTPQPQQPPINYKPVVVRKRVLPIFSDDHPKHRQVVSRFCSFLQKHCKCEVSLLEWKKSIGPTLEMWLTNEIALADVVLVICSKGTRLKYNAKAKRDQLPTDGVYGDVFVSALPLLDVYSRQDNASDKFLVAYFDYSKEKDIPVPFQRFAKYHLMKSMELLFLRIHGMVRDGPISSQSVSELQESAYPKLEMGKALHEAIQDMDLLVRSDGRWYENHISRLDPDTHWSESEVNPSSMFTDRSSCQPFLEPVHDSVDSAYISNEPKAPQSFFQDNGSIGQSSDADAFEESLRQFQETGFDRQEASLNNGYIQPRTRLYSDDIQVAMVDDPFPPDNFFSDIQIGNTR